MTQDAKAIHETVRKHYSERISQSAGCCGTDSCCTPEQKLYPEELLTTLSDGESVPSYGCGDPITLAALEPGQTVLDLGSGAGLDCFFAAKKVGEAGHVIGVDMTPEMIERARAGAKRMNLGNVEFREGLLEQLPVDDDSVDVIISNCVINLAPDKRKVFDEVFRVLKPGGKVAVSDIVTEGPIPEKIRSNLEAWAGCIAGALDVNAYRHAMESAGLVDVSISPTYFDESMVDEAMRDLGDQPELRSIPRDTIAKSIFSARITARKV